MLFYVKDRNSTGNKKGNASNLSTQGVAMKQKMETSCSLDSDVRGVATKQKIETSCSLDNDNKRPSSHSSAINDPIKRAALAKFMDDGANDCDKTKCHSTSQRCQIGEESFLKLLEAKPVELLKFNTSVSSHQTRRVLKKSKIPLPEGYCFGRKQLFLMSLKLHQKCKKKMKKQRQSCRNKTNKTILDLRTDSQGASTSGKYRPPMCSFRKDFHTTSGRTSKREKGVDSCNDSCQMNNEEIHRNCSSDDSTEGQQSVKFKNANDKDMLQSCSLSLLKTSLREATVAKWDVEGLQASHINEWEDAPKRKVGYLLDEWDEEYDRGRRKKLKIRQQRFDGPNPFQATAELKTLQKMKKIVPR